MITDILMKTPQINDKYVHSALSYQIIGVLFEVYNKLGYGHSESVYQKALAIAFSYAGLKYVEQLYSPVVFKERVVGKNYLDFCIEDKVVLEIKKGDYFVKAHIEQVYRYLRSKNLQLGILAYFAPRTVHIKRVVNLC